MAALIVDYTPQLMLYKKAVGCATNKKVLKTILHLPMMDSCVELIQQEK